MSDDIRKKLQGRAFTRTMKDQGTNKWRLAKATGISYRTLAFWEKGLHVPNLALAEKVGRALGILV